MTSIFFVLSQIESLRVMQRMEGVDVTTSAVADYQCHMEPLSSPTLRRDCRLYSLTERTKREVKSAPIRREKPENVQRRRAFETALIYTVNTSAALAYAAVSNLFK